MIATFATSMTRPENSKGRAARPAKEPSARPAGDAGAKPRSRRRRGSAYAGNAPSQLTSLPTTRGAYVDTRHWLLKQFGPVCAYCGQRGDEEEMTLDHVTPRKGQTAYDRRDNLVLACKRCNGLKADKPILVFLLARRERAALLLRYGSHLSPMLLDLARDVAGPEAAARAARLADPDYPYAD
jgi:5-methylcytosine-specific restriction endonuclease McrA